jgi:hypothetical protein
MDNTLDLILDCSGWFYSDDSDIDELLQDDDTEMVVIILAVKEVEDRVKLLDQRKGSQMGRL